MVTETPAVLDCSLPSVCDPATSESLALVLAREWARVNTACADPGLRFLRYLVATGCGTAGAPGPAVCTGPVCTYDPSKGSFAPFAGYDGPAQWAAYSCR